MTRSGRKQLLAAVLGLALLSFSSAPANAVVITFEDVAAQGGTLSYGGAGGPLIGDDIVFTHVTGPGAPLFCNPTCLMDFTTGANTLEGPPAWTFAAGGSITIVGDLFTAPGGGGTLIAAGTLLSGSFGAPVVVTGPPFIQIGTGSDTKNEDLVDFYGLANPFTFTELAIDTPSTVDLVTGAFSGEVSNSLLNNTGSLAAVSEASALLLFGAGLVGVAIYGRRRLKGPKP